MSTAPLIAAGSDGPQPSPVPPLTPAYPLSISITPDGWLAKPFFRCGACGKLIEDAHKANLVWKPDDPVQPAVVHKGGCDHALQQAGYRHWTQLNVAILYLLNNSHVNMQETNRQAHNLSQLP